MDIVLAFIIFLMGISIGSFLNVVADRVPLGKSIISPPSHCFHCGHKLESRDLIPLISYLWLRGKCRYCRTPIPVRSMLIELITGLLFVLAFMKMGLGWSLIGSLLYISVFVVLIIVDMEIGILPHLIVYPAIGIVIVIAGINYMVGVQPDIGSAMLGLCLGAVLFLILWGIPRLFKKSLIGFGDVGMAGLLGASVGFPLVVIALCLAILTGGATVILLIALRRRKLSDAVSFGLYLSLGAIGTIFMGKEILNVATLLFAG
jgi:leader peptidase (prepilin peptidase) / N-methyltransferase